MKWLERKREEKREKEKQRWREAILNDQYVPAVDKTLIGSSIFLSS